MYKKGLKTNLQGIAENKLKELLMKQNEPDLHMVMWIGGGKQFQYLQNEFYQAKLIKNKEIANND